MEMGLGRGWVEAANAPGLSIGATTGKQNLCLTVKTTEAFRCAPREDSQQF